MLKLLRKLEKLALNKSFLSSSRLQRRLKSYAMKMDQAKFSGRCTLDNLTQLAITSEILEKYISLYCLISLAYFRVLFKILYNKRIRYFYFVTVVLAKITTSHNFLVFLVQKMRDLEAFRFF